MFIEIVGTILAACLFSLDVSVSLPNSNMTVPEDIEQIMVCVTLTASAPTEREFRVQLNTIGDYAEGNFITLYSKVSLMP